MEKLIEFRLVSDRSLLLPVPVLVLTGFPLPPLEVRTLILLFEIHETDRVVPFYVPLKSSPILTLLPSPAIHILSTTFSQHSRPGSIPTINLASPPDSTLPRTFSLFKIS